MSEATDIVDQATSGSGNVDKQKLAALLVEYESAQGYQPDQDWEEQTTTWRFEDGSAIKNCNGEIHVYGNMPKSSVTGWYLVEV